MCGRYYIPGEDDEIEAMIAALNHDERIKTGEIFPTDTVPALTAKGAPALMKWGFSRFDGKGQIINARSETAAGKAMFARPLREMRCLLPAGYYFEWQKTGAAKKQKFAVSLPGRETLYMAGLYRLERESELPVFVILTRAAAPGLSCIHDRMPVVLPKPACEMWLDGGDAAKALAMAAGDMRAREVM